MGMENNGHGIIENKQIITVAESDLKSEYTIRSQFKTRKPEICNVVWGALYNFPVN